MIFIHRQCPDEKNAHEININTTKCKKILGENSTECFHLKVCPRVCWDPFLEKAV